MEMKLFVTIVIALSLCEFTFSADVAKAFTDEKIVPDAVDVAPQKEIKVKMQNVLDHFN